VVTAVLASPISRYDTSHVEIYASARKHGIDDLDIVHALEHAMATGEQDDGALPRAGPVRDVLEVVSVLRDDGTEIVVHARRMPHLRVVPSRQGDPG